MSRNYLINGDFARPVAGASLPSSAGSWPIPDPYKLLCPPSSGTLPDPANPYDSLIPGSFGWSIGPGVGASLTWSMQRFDPTQTDVPPGPSWVPEQFLRLTWIKVATQGEAQYQNTNTPLRYTFLENHVYHCGELMGTQIDFYLYARVLAGPLNVRPIVWVNWSESRQDYVIIDTLGTFLLANGGVWYRVGGTAQLPPFCQTNHPIDQTFYIGVGLDFLEADGPTLDLAKAWLAPTGVQPTHRRFEEDKAMDLAGAF